MLNMDTAMLNLASSMQYNLQIRGNTNVWDTSFFMNSLGNLLKYTNVWQEAEMFYAMCYHDHTDALDLRLQNNI